MTFRNVPDTHSFQKSLLENFIGRLLDISCPEQFVSDIVAGEGQKADWTQFLRETKCEECSPGYVWEHAIDGVYLCGMRE
jgi:hypothetical protein